MGRARDRLHRLIDEISDSELHAVEKYLEYIRDTSDPVRHALENAPVDDESLTDDERAAIKEAEDDLRAGRTISHEEVKRELGL